MDPDAISVRRPADRTVAAAVPPAEAGEEAALAVRIAGAAPAGDRAAEAELYRRLAPRVRRYGLRHLRDGHAANDLMQVVMVRLIEQLRSGRVREPQRIVSFVFGVCRMVLLEQRRGDARHAQWLAQCAADEAAAEVAAVPVLDHLRVASCLERLAERERSVILLSFYEDRSADDVAAMLGTTSGNVRVIRHRGIARLRDCVGGAPR